MEKTTLIIFLGKLVCFLLFPGIAHSENRTGMKDRLQFRRTGVKPQQQQQLQWRDVRDDIINSTVEYCGRTRICKYKTDSQKKSCSFCNPCGCDDICVKYGDCCIDKFIDDVILKNSLEDTLPFEAPYTECVETRVGRRKAETENKTRSERQNMFGSCPDVIDALEADKLREECEKSVISQDDKDNKDATFTINAARISLSQALTWATWPMYSSDSGISYKNRACAKCHGDSDNLVSWDMEVKCVDKFTTAMSFTLSDLFDSILTQPLCDVNFKPPSGVEPRLCYLRDVNVSVCNVTGQRMTYDQDLWRACEVFSGPYLKREEKYYRNVYCKKCNSEQSQAMPCLGPGRDLFDQPTFFLVISPHAIRNVNDRRQNRPCVCDEHQIWDPFASRCRNLHCRLGSYLSRDTINQTIRCVPEEAPSRGLTYDLHLVVQVVPISGRLLELFDDVFAKLYKKLFSLLKTTIEKHNVIRTLSSTMYGVRQTPFCRSNVWPPRPRHQRNLYEELTTLTLGISAEFRLNFELPPPTIANQLLDLDGMKWHVTNLFDTPGRRDLVVANVTSVLAPGKPSILSDMASDFSCDGDNDRSAEKGDNNNAAPIQYYPLDEGRATLLVIHEEFDKAPTDYLEVRNTLLCPFFMADESLKVKFKVVSHSTQPFTNDDQHVLVHNGSGFELSFKDFYRLRDGRLMVCAPQLMTLMKEKEAADQIMKAERNNREVYDEDHMLTVVSYASLTVSCAAFLLTLMTYFLFPSLRTLPGKNIMALVGSFLCTTMFSFTTNLPASGSVLCQTMGVAYHFSLLCSFTWMVIGCWHVHQIFTHVMENAHSGGRRGSRLFVKYCVVATLIPLLIVTVTIVANVIVHSSGDGDDGGDDDKYNSGSGERVNSSSPGTSSFGPFGASPTVTKESFPCTRQTVVDFGYGQGPCYISNPLSVLLAAAIPCCLTVLFNLVLFIRTIYSLVGLTSEHKMLKKEQTIQVRTYAKLSTITGLNWIPGIVNIFVPSKIFLYTFVIAAGVQGLYVFCAFVLNTRVMGLYRALLQREAAYARKATRRSCFDHNGELDNSNRDTSTNQDSTASF